jgi:uncharacterized protein with ATP-grasp and redox domains
MSKKLFYFFWSVFLILFYMDRPLISLKKESFLITKIQPKSKSKNVLKEDIGEELKKALHSCAAVTNELGKLQQKVALFQKKLLSRVESLVNHERPFKKAKKSTLTDALKIMSEITAKLEKNQKHVVAMVAQMNKNVCLQTVGRS